MNRLAIFKKTRKEQVYDKLYKLITSSGMAPGERLSPLVELARRFDTSVFTVQSAMKRLEKDGYITKRPGAGTFIASKHPALTMKDMIGLHIGKPGAHLWGDLSAMIAGKVLQGGQVPVYIQADQADRNQIIERICHTEARCFIIHGRWLPVESFYSPMFSRKVVIAVVEWACADERPGLYRVLTDWRAGGQLVAQHLYDLGHRHVLLLGQEVEMPLLDNLDKSPQQAGRSFVERFVALGGRCETMLSDVSADPDIRIDVDAFVARLRRPDAPTAIFGLRDVEAWIAQRAIRERLCDMEDRIAIVGYYDTPWSQAAHPLITTVSLDLPRITEEVMKVVDLVRHDKQPESNTILVSPQLIVRQTSRARQA